MIHSSMTSEESLDLPMNTEVSGSFLRRLYIEALKPRGDTALLGDGVGRHILGRDLGMYMPFGYCALSHSQYPRP